MKASETHFVFRCSNELRVGVVVAEINIGLLLDDGIVPAIVDAECNQRDILAFDGAGRDSRVLRLEVGCKF